MASQHTNAPAAATATLTTRSRAQRTTHRLVAILLVIAGILSLLYLSVSVLMATELVYSRPKPITRTPADVGLAYADVSFPSQTDNLTLRGWFIPGILPNGQLTTDRVIITVHGNGGNRDDVLNFSDDLVRHGFAVLTFDLRGMGQSAPAPNSLGYFEQRDVLGAVDYLRDGSLPYAALGRPRIIGGWGVSLGAATMLLAAAQQPAIRAVVSDAAFADIVPIAEREIPKLSHLPAFFAPGGLEATQLLYGINYYADRPVAVVARIAPRPIFFIHGTADTYIPPSNMAALVAAADAPAGAQVQSWLVPGAGHAKAYTVAQAQYVSRVVNFFDNALGPDSHLSA